MATGDGATAVRHAEEAAELTVLQAVAWRATASKRRGVGRAAVPRCRAASRRRSEAWDATAWFGLAAMGGASACLLIDIWHCHVFSTTAARTATK